MSAGRGEKSVLCVGNESESVERYDYNRSGKWPIRRLVRILANCIIAEG